MEKSFLQKVIDQFTKSAESQENKGIEKYGHEVQPHDPKWDWNLMAEEELVDAFKYLHADRIRRDEILKVVVGDLEDIAKELVEPGSVTNKAMLAMEIKELADKLKPLSAIFKKE
jgi:hypothetical protein